jgi:intracellular sulfur oxidation DsrE/DsrF family protein
MKKPILFLLALLFVFVTGTQAQRTAILKANEAKLIYPLYKGSYEMGVMPVEGTTYPYQHKGICKLAFDISAATPDSSRDKANSGLLEAMRILNLHVAAGVPKEKLDVVIVFHGPAAMSFLNDENYNKRFKMNNPNMSLVSQLKDNGVKFVVCGQTMAFRNFTLDVFSPGTMKAYSARTAIADLQQRGYAMYTLSE